MLVHIHARLSALLHLRIHPHLGCLARWRLLSPFMDDPVSLVAVVALPLTPEKFDRTESCEASGTGGYEVQCLVTAWLFIAVLEEAA